MSMGKLDDYILKIIPEFIGKIPLNMKKRHVIESIFRHGGSKM